MWFDLSGDARLGRCATEGCGGQPASRLEADGVGSNYCSGCRARIEGNPDDIVGHKTIDTGQRDEHGLPIHRHEPLTRAEGRTLWEQSQRAHADRVARMPDEKSALHALHDAYTRLRDMGWRDAVYCPKDGSTFEIIEVGSTGIFRAHYSGEWPSGSWWAEDAGDLWPSRPCLFRLLPAAQAEYDAKMAAARERMKAWREAGCPVDDDPALIQT